MKRPITLNLYKEHRLEMSYVDINALVNNSTYSFIVEGIKTTLNNEEFTRENNEFKFYLGIKNKKATYLLKEQNTLFDIDVEKINFKKENNNIILEYKISSDENEFKIELIDKGEINE